MNDAAVRLSVIIIHYRRPDMTAALLDRCARDRSAGEVELLVVNNGSPDPFTALPPDTACRVLHAERNLGYAAACNLGAREARGPLLLFCNNDLLFDDDLFGPLCALADADPRIGAVGPGIAFPDGRFQLSWSEDPGLASEWRERRRQRESRRGGGAAYAARAAASRDAREADWVTGACMLVRRGAFDAIGGFDEAYFFYFEDADLCRRLRDGGYTVRYAPAIRVTHFGGGSTLPNDPALLRAYRFGQLRFYARHNGRVSFLLVKTYLSLKLLTAPYRSAFPPRDALRFLRRMWLLPFRQHGRTPDGGTRE
jgi:N-acetylglucosaminyl-diphospho-decaprenol L-rhamnosyltransferase